VITIVACRKTWQTQTPAPNLPGIRIGTCITIVSCRQDQAHGWSGGAARIGPAAIWLHQHHRLPLVCWWELCPRGHERSGSRLGGAAQLARDLGNLPGLTPRAVLDNFVAGWMFGTPLTARGAAPWNTSQQLRFFFPSLLEASLPSFSAATASHS
jgi:hypothetical protein